MWICKGELSAYYKSIFLMTYYKNYKNFLNLCHHYNDFDLEAKWEFFATSHEKFAVDGIEGRTKQLTVRASLQRLQHPNFNSRISLPILQQNYRKHIA